MPKIQTFNSQKKPVTDMGEQIINIELDQLVFKEEEKAAGKIYPDPKAIVANAKSSTSQFNSCDEDSNVVIHYNDNVFKQNDSLTERLASKEIIDQKEGMGKINPATRAYSKHRTVTLPITADAVCDGIALASNEHYQYLLTIINAPNAGNSKKGNGVSSSAQDMQLYFSGKSTDNYKQVMKEIYRIALLAQSTSSTVVVPPIGLGVYLSSLEGRDMYFSKEFIKDDIINHKNDFTFIESTQTLYFTNRDGQFEEVNNANIAAITKFLVDNEAAKYGAVHLHMGTIKSFGAEFEQFVKGLPVRSDRPQVTEINLANYEALKEVLEELDQEVDNTIKVVVLCAVRKEGEDLFKTLELKSIDVLQSKGDMLQTTQQISKINIPVGLFCAGSDHDIGGATRDCLDKVPAMIPGEEQISLTSNYMNTLANALLKGYVKYIPYHIEICEQDLSKLPKNAQTVSVSQFSVLNSETLETRTKPEVEATQFTMS